MNSAHVNLTLLRCRPTHGEESDAVPHFCQWHKQPHHIDLVQRKKKDKLTSKEYFLVAGGRSCSSSSTSRAACSEYRDELPVIVYMGAAAAPLLNCHAVARCMPCRVIDAANAAGVEHIHVRRGPGWRVGEQLFRPCRWRRQASVAAEERRCRPCAVVGRRILGRGGFLFIKTRLACGWRRLRRGRRSRTTVFCAQWERWKGCAAAKQRRRRRV